jgi:hypothetical protein
LKVIGFVSTAVLSLTLGVTATAYAQGEQHPDKKDRPQQQQDKHEQARHEEGKPTPQHAQRQDQSKHEEHAQQSQKHDQNRSQERAQQQKQQDQHEHHAQQQQQDRNVQRDRAQQQQQERRTQQHAQQRPNQPPQRTQERQRVEHSAWQQHRSQHWESDHRTWQQRGGYKGYRIPDARFRGYFGRDHEFRISGLPFLVVGGYPRFQYSGYWFSPVDPWPEYWATDWYDTDDVYVMYVDNGYYMYNRRYPTTGIAIRISL